MNLIVHQSKEKTLLPKIMRAALRLFVSQGIDSTTTKEIAQAAGVAEGSLYRHYKSKEELAWYIFQTHLAKFTEDLNKAVLAHTSAHDRIRVFVEEVFKAFEDDRELFTYLILSEHKEFQKYAETYDHPGILVQRIVADGQASGEIRATDGMVLSSLFVGAVIRACTVRVYGSITSPLTTYIHDVIEALWAMVKKEARNDANG